MNQPSLIILVMPSYDADRFVCPPNIIGAKAIRVNLSDAEAEDSKFMTRIFTILAHSVMRAISNKQSI